MTNTPALLSPCTGAQVVPRLLRGLPGLVQRSAWAEGELVLSSLLILHSQDPDTVTPMLIDMGMGKLLGEPSSWGWVQSVTHPGRPLQRRWWSGVAAPSQPARPPACSCCLAPCRRRCLPRAAVRNQQPLSHPRVRACPPMWPLAPPSRIRLPWWAAGLQAWCAQQPPLATGKRTVCCATRWSWCWRACATARRRRTRWLRARWSGGQAGRRGGARDAAARTQLPGAASGAGTDTQPEPTRIWVQRSTAPDRAGPQALPRATAAAVGLRCRLLLQLTRQADIPAAVRQHAAGALAVLATSPQLGEQLGRSCGPDARAPTARPGGGDPRDRHACLLPGWGAGARRGGLLLLRHGAQRRPAGRACSGSAPGDTPPGRWGGG
jgi:hypothetical protein